MSQRKFFTALFLSVFFIGILSDVLQHPESQHVLIGSNATFSCKMRYLHSDIIWEAIFPNGSRYMQLSLDRRTDIHIIHKHISEDSIFNSTLTVVISPSNAQSWNRAQLQCVGDTGSGFIHSDDSSLNTYESLTPSSVLITSINTNTLHLSWTTAFPWQEFQINGFNVNITNINRSQRVLETLAGLQNSMEISRFNLTNTDVLHPCTEFNFSVSSVSATNGESNPGFIIGGFDEEPNESDIVSHVVYFQANGTPLVDLEVELPTTVCSYQTINYSIVIREELALEFNQTFGPFVHRGSGTFDYRVTSGLTRNKNYSVSLFVETMVGDSETSTYFDTQLWHEFSDDSVTSVMKNTNTSSCDCSQSLSVTMQDHQLLTNNSEASGEVVVSDRNTLISYIVFLSILSAVVVLILIIIIVLSVGFSIFKGKGGNGGHDTKKRVMVNNPIYNQGPVYDTIPTTLSEILAHSEVNTTSTVSGYQNSSSTFTAANAYIDEPHNSSSHLSNIDVPNASYDAANGSRSSENECLDRTRGAVENIEDTYTLMFPGGTGAN